MVRSGSDPLRAGGQRSEVGRLRDGNQRGSTEGFHGGPHQALPSGEQVTTQNGLTDKDLLELEALKLQGLRDLETQPLRDMLKRKEGASGGSGSFQSVVGDGGSSGSEPSSHATWNTTDTGLRYANGPARDCVAGKVYRTVWCWWTSSS